MPEGFAPHVVRRAKGQGVLGVADPAPKRQVGPEVALERLRLHAGGGNLHRVENIDPDLDQVRDERARRPADVKHHFGVGFALDRLDQPPLPGLEHAPVQRRRDEGAALRGQVVADCDHLNVGANLVEHGFVGGDQDFGDPVYQRLGEARGQCQVAHERCHAAQVLGKLEDPAAEDAAHYQRVISVFIQRARLFAQPAPARGIGGVRPGKGVQGFERRLPQGMLNEVKVVAALLGLA